MRVAVTIWEDMVSTVCDFSNRLLVFDVVGNNVENRSFASFETGILPEAVNQLTALGVQVLLCGAISRPFERMIRSTGLKVVPSLRGPVEEVIRAYLNDGLADTRFILPGFGSGTGRMHCRKRRRRGAV